MDERDYKAMNEELQKAETDAKPASSDVFSQQEVRSLIGAIYSEFAETNWKYQNTETLKCIIKAEVEQHPLKPIKIFVK